MTIPSPPPRPLDAHKGSFGTVIVVGGCPTMFGAPALAARAAFRSGAGLVKIATDAQTLPFALLAEPSATGVVLSQASHNTTYAALAALNQADPDERAVLAVGPGWGGPGREDWRSDFVQRLATGRRAVVLDADGLNLLATLKEIKAKAPLVLTPHPGEFKRLAQAFGVAGDPAAPGERAGCAMALAQKVNAVVLLKGRRTVVSDGAQVYENHTGNPVLATAGSGDVLTGLIAGLLAQGMKPFEAACLGAHLHGQAADRWRDAHGGRGMLARELADGLTERGHSRPQ